MDNKTMISVNFIVLKQNFQYLCNSKISHYGNNHKEILC